MPKATPININDQLAQLTFFASRTPQTTDEEIQGAFGLLSEYRDGGVFIAHYAGLSEWERHEQGDEIVMVVEGETTLVLLSDNIEVGHKLNAGGLFVVPQGLWHRFESPEGVKVMTVTPQPTEHSIERPQDKTVAKDVINQW